MKSFRIALLLLLVMSGIPASAAYNPANIPSVSSISQMKSLPVAQYPTVDVTGTQGGLFIWTMGSPPSGYTCSGGVGGDGGTIFCSTSTNSGYWLRKTNGVLTSLMYGTDPTGTNDSTSAMQLAWNAASSSKLNLPIVDPAGVFKLSSTLTATPGLSYTGAGVGADAIVGGNGTILDFSTASNSNPCVSLQLPNGTNTIVGASFYNFYEKCPGTYGIRENSVSGGFTNDGSSQEYLFDVNIQNVSISGGTTAAIQLSKCFHANINASVNNNFFTPGDHVDLEGCDTSQISGGRYYPTNGSAIKFVTHGTFGNYDLISGAVEIGAFDNSHPSIYLDGRSDTVGAGVNIEGNSTGSYISIGPDGFTHSIQNVIVSANGSTHWLDFGGNCPEITNIQNNNPVTSTPGIVSAPTRCPIWYNSSILRQIWYNANPDSGSSLPFISNNTDANRNGFQWWISPSNAKSLAFGDGCGNTATATTGAFDFSQCSAGAFLDFYSSNSDIGNMVGSLTTQVVAYCNGGTGTLAIRGDDGSHSTTVQTANITLASSPKIFSNAFSGAGSYSTFMIFMTRPGTCADPRVISVGVNAS